MVPSINVSRPPAIPAIVFPDEGEHQEKRNVPTINVPEISISVEDTSAPTAPTPPRTAPAPLSYNQQQQQQSRRPLPNPNASPFRKTPSTYSTTGRPSAACTTCYQHISGRIVSALGSRFHPECFRCCHCAEKLEHVGFFPEPEKNRTARAQAAGVNVEELDKRFYCHLDFHELFSPRCKNCETPIEGEVVVACGETWHVGHFFCAECGDPFSAETRFVEKDKYAWCLPCYNKRYSSKCRKCKQPVTDTVVKAMGGEWHVECFCCAVSYTIFIFYFLKHHP
ncbi:hypothetical protein EV426DRAFT_537120 [Tirmania nivea]|nr:hypothetical protein EV426DRAFT_537120 [Tirmania nivea]